MIPTFFNTPEKRAGLHQLAIALEGTPFFPNSEAPGKDGGMDCIRILHYIYRTCGVIPRLELAPQIMDHGQHSDRSLLVEAFTTWPELKSVFVELPDCSPENILPGDALCFRAGRVPHHGGIMVTPTSFLHTLKPAGAHLMLLGAAVRGWRILGELQKVYRPLPVAVA